jgi:hypothetical protein
MAITDEILQYIQTHHEQIHMDMDGRLSEIKEVTKVEGKKKRHELSNSATKSLTRHSLSVSVKFD